MANSEGGVYFSPADAQDWEPDLDVGGLNHMLFNHGATMAGLWKANPGAPGRSEQVTIPSRETIMVLEGSVRVTVDGGESRSLGVGDMLSMPEGSLVGWDPAPDCKVFWIYS